MKKDYRFTALLVAVPSSESLCEQLCAQCRIPRVASAQCAHTHKHTRSHTQTSHARAPSQARRHEHSATVHAYINYSCLSIIINPFLICCFTYLQSLRCIRFILVLFAFIFYSDIHLCPCAIRQANATVCRPTSYRFFSFVLFFILFGPDEFSSDFNNLFHLEYGSRRHNILPADTITPKDFSFFREVKRNAFSWISFSRFALVFGKYHHLYLASMMDGPQFNKMNGFERDRRSVAVSQFAHTAGAGWRTVPWIENSKRRCKRAQRI